MLVRNDLVKKNKASNRCINLSVLLRSIPLSENCTMIHNSTEFDTEAVEMLNGAKLDGPMCGRFKSHPKEKDKRWYTFKL